MGNALLAQKRPADADPLLRAGFDGVNARVATVPNRSKPRVTESLERVIWLYDELGQKDKADEWRKKLADWQATKPSEKTSK